MQKTTSKDVASRQTLARLAKNFNCTREGIITLIYRIEHRHFGLYEEETKSANGEADKAIWASNAITAVNQILEEVRDGGIKLLAEEEVPNKAKIQIARLAAREHDRKRREQREVASEENTEDESPPTPTRALRSATTQARK